MSGMCEKCAVGREAENFGSTRCQDCGYWEQQPNAGQSECLPNYGFGTYAFSVFLVAARVGIITLRASTLHFRISDVIQEDGITVIQTYRETGLWLRKGATVGARFKDTGNVFFDDPSVTYRVAKKAKDRVSILDGSGNPLLHRLDTSMGTMHICFPHRLLVAGTHIHILKRSLPVWLEMILIILIGILAAEYIFPEKHGVRSVHVLYTALLGVLAAAVATAADYKWSSTWRPTPLQKAVRDYRKKLESLVGPPQRGPRGPGRAITAHQLYELHAYFQAFIMDRTMYYLCPNIVIPLTAISRTSYAELVGPSRVKWFVSHYWGCSFGNFVESITKHAEFAASRPDREDSLPRYAEPVRGKKSRSLMTILGRETKDGRLTAWSGEAYWICTFSNTQWNVAEEVGSSWEMSSFYLALRAPTCLGTALVLGPSAMPLTRSWCVFEMLQTLLLEKEFAGVSQSTSPASCSDATIRLETPECAELKSSPFEGLMLCTALGVLNRGAPDVNVTMSLAGRLARFRMQNATATVEADKQMIDALVMHELGGFEAMDNLVRDSMLKALHDAKDLLLEDFEALENALVGMATATQSLCVSMDTTPASSGETCV